MTKARPVKNSANLAMPWVADCIYELFEADTTESLNPERDQDNAAPKHKPHFAQDKHPRLAPMGAIGTKQNLPTPEKQKAQDDFKLTPPNELKREFQSITSGHDKDRGHER